MFFQIVNETYETHETLKSFSKIFGFFVSTGGYSEYFCNFASHLLDGGSGESGKYRAGHYIVEKASHDALSIGNLKLPLEDVCQRQKQSLMPRVCWICVSRCVRGG